MAEIIEQQPQEAAAGLPNITTTSAGYRIARTAPALLLRHDISDDELETLGVIKRSHLWDFMWTMLGAALGAAPSATEHIYEYFHAGTAINMKGIGEIVFASVAAAIFLVLFFAVYSERKSAPDLAKAIRERTRQTVS